MDSEHIAIIMEHNCKKCQEKKGDCTVDGDYCEEYQAKYLSLLGDDECTSFNGALIGEIISICGAYSNNENKVKDISALLCKHDLIMMGIGAGIVLILGAIVKIMLSIG